MAPKLRDAGLVLGGKEAGSDEDRDSEIAS